MDKILRLDRLLANQGLTTRAKAPVFLARHKVMLGGEAPRSRRDPVLRPDEVTIDGKPLEFPYPLHIILHKPVGYVCSRERDFAENKIIYDLLPPSFIHRIPPLVSAGRLDKWASGLVFLSQNGTLVHRVASPKRKSATFGKVYEVKLQRPLRGDEEKLFSSGEMMIRSEAKPLKKAKFEIIDEAMKLVRITLYEGRYHQLRRMLATVGNRSVSIKRIATGPLTLAGLREGHWRELTSEEMEDLGSKLPRKRSFSEFIEIETESTETETGLNGDVGRDDDVAERENFDEVEGGQEITAKPQRSKTKPKSKTKSISKQPRKREQND